MTDKNEGRIFIRIFTEHPCKKCSDRDSVFCSCGLYNKYASAKTRAELVERMAKAMCNADGVSCTDCKWREDAEGCKSHMKCYDYAIQAEAALDAILQKKKTLEERIEDMFKENPGIEDFDKFFEQRNNNILEGKNGKSI